MSENFQQNIISWVKLDNKITTLRNEMRELRSEKNALTEEIYTIAEQNNYDRSTIEISDGKLRFQQVKQTNPLTFKFLEKCLHECLDNEETVTSIIKYIKSKRESKYSYEIRRTYNKE
tara:strand:- start:719 stop:1072 length:354 start_codon:yes stop_codon:yes gene_type:complete